MKKLQIGKRIENARDELGLTRERLAEKINVASTTVYRWERDLLMPSFDMAVKLSEALGRSLNYFAGIDEGTVANVDNSLDLIHQIASLDEESLRILKGNLEMLSKPKQSKIKKKEA